MSDAGADGAPVRRRRLRVQGASSAGLALVLLAGFLLTAQVPQGDAPERAIAAGPPPAQGLAAPRAPAPREPRRAAPATRREVRAPVAAPRQRRRAAPPPAPPRSRGQAAQQPYGPMSLRYERDAHSDSLCPAAPDSGPLGLTCRQADVAATAGGHQLRFRVCPTTSTRFELRFTTEAEVAMSVRDSSGRVVWTWRPARPFGDHGHVLVSEVGACWLWATSWDGVDDRGRPLPEGRYQLRVDFLEVEDTATYTRSFDAS